MPDRDRTFRATYRVQLHPGFGFDAAAGIAGYLEALGVSHLYASPYLQAAPGSTHGYDVVDHSRVNEELGGGEAHRRFCAALGEHRLGQVLDVVPNHMSIAGGKNAWWWDVLENGPSSRYASYFDVDWDPPEAKLRNTVSMPILGDHYGRVIEAGELKLVLSGGAFTIAYYDNTLPVAPDSLDSILGEAARTSGSDELAFVASSLARLPLPTAVDSRSVQRRHRDKEVLRTRVERLAAEDAGVAEAIDQVVAAVNADADRMDALLQRQNYRLAYWRTSSEELDYRRFFDINTLVGLRIEDEQVFADTHRLVLGWLRDGVLDGVRIDHPDGLRDPEEYFRRIAGAAPCAWVVAEKILEPGERLPQAWPVAGTTGYDFLNRVGALFVDREGEAAMSAVYAAFTGDTASYAEVARDKKQYALRELLASDLSRLTELFVRCCEHNRRYRDYTRFELRQVLRDVLAELPVYRTYVRPESDQVTESDRAYIEDAVAAARARRPDLDGDLFTFLSDILLLRKRGEPESELVERLQQTSGPAMAKGVEDTAFYCYNRLVSLNEVGGDPGRFGMEPEEFHAANQEARATVPDGMLATSTHDTKRSEDVRARLNLLSQMPARWGEAVQRWSRMNERHRRDGMPDRGAEYLYYQALVGAHPLPVDRACAYMEKAAKEAKVHTSWTSPSEAYDSALKGFVEATLADRAFTEDVAAFVEPLLDSGWKTSLAQKLITLTSPGVPDIYQGTELWDLSLVDPDNRRPVDFDLRRRLLAEVTEMPTAEAWARRAEGLPKLLVVQRTLELRRRRPELFGPDASYEPLLPQGACARHLLAYVRGGGAAVVAPRLVLGMDGWQDTRLELPPGRWTNAFTGEVAEGGSTEVGVLLRSFPVALLHSEPAA